MLTGSILSYVDLGNALSSPDDDRRQTLATVDALDEKQPHTLVVAPDGALWLNAENGIIELNDGGTLTDVTDDIWVTFSEDDGLPLTYIDELKTDGLDEKWMLGYGCAVVQSE